MQILEKILNEVKSDSTVIFDLDSTLFDVSPRITAILHNFALNPEHQRKYPEYCEQILKVKPDPSDYGVRRTLERHGVHLTDMNFGFMLVEYWKERFFSGQYIHHDTPYEGAVEFVHDVKAKGAQVLYLTGRDIPRMKDATIESLKAHGLPLTHNTENLILKPSPDISDAAFKQKYFANLKQGKYYFFENEPLNIHLAMVESPYVKPIFVDTVHSNRAPLPSERVPRIKHWLR